MLRQTHAALCPDMFYGYIQHLIYMLSIISSDRLGLKKPVTCLNHQEDHCQVISHLLLLQALIIMGENFCPQVSRNI